MAARLVHDLAQLRRQEDSKGPAAHGWCAESVAETPALGTLDHSHHRTCPSTWSPERRDKARGERDAERLGRRSTIVGLQPSAVPNFAKSLTVVARRGFSDAA